jgi:hypothetical protein
MPVSGISLDLTINTQGLLRKIKQFTDGVAAQPGLEYELVNIAKDPDGVYYFKFVDEGTGPKEVIDAKSLVFRYRGRLFKAKVVGGNPPHYLTKRVIPIMRNYFKNRINRFKRRESMTLTRLSNIFYDSMEKAKKEIEQITPELQEKYFDEGWTPEKGLLKKSYKIRSTKNKLEDIAGPNAII